MNQRIPAPIRPLLQSYLSLMQQQLPGWPHAFYLEGSIALGEFNEHFSDIDFIALLNHRATLAETVQLRRVHKAIEKNYPQWKMSGSYFHFDDFSRWPDAVESHPYYHDGVLRPNGRFEFDSVAGWILKNHDLALIGPEPQALSFSVNWTRLAAAMRENLNSYWVSWARRPDRIVALLSDWGIQWAVLGVLRQFYSFRENSITTKIKAGEYALNCVPARWHRLIREAIRIRERTRSSAYRSRIVRAIEAANFLNDIIRSCNVGFSSLARPEPEPNDIPMK